MAKKNAGVSKPSEPTKSEAKRTEPTPSKPAPSVSANPAKAAIAAAPKSGAKTTTPPAGTKTAGASSGTVETKPGATLSHEDVARAAYLRWERYGGDAESNWLAAERELQGKA